MWPSKFTWLLPFIRPREFSLAWSSGAWECSATLSQSFKHSENNTEGWSANKTRKVGIEVPAGKAVAAYILAEAVRELDGVIGESRSVGRMPSLAAASAYLCRLNFSGSSSINFFLSPVRQALMYSSISSSLGSQEGRAL